MGVVQAGCKDIAAKRFFGVTREELYEAYVIVREWLVDVSV